MNMQNNQATHETEDKLPEEYRDASWPQSGRFVFGPWCSLGAWPAIFGVMEMIEEQEEDEP